MSKKRRNRKRNQDLLAVTKNIVQGVVSAMVKNAENDPNKQDFIRSMGLLAGHFSKGLLEGAGCQVNYIINGEDIAFIKDLDEIGIKERITLALKDERYEDAAALKKLLPANNKKTIYLDPKPIIGPHPGHKPE